MSQTIAEYLFRRLHAWGVRRIYGFPGDGINGIMGALNRIEGTEHEVRFVQARHEEEAAFMACAAVSEGLLDQELTDDEKEWGRAGRPLQLRVLGRARLRAAGGGEAWRHGRGRTSVRRCLLVDRRRDDRPRARPLEGALEIPPSTHAYALVSHIVFGLTAEAVRRLVRDLL